MQPSARASIIALELFEEVTAMNHIAMNEAASNHTASNHIASNPTALERDAPNHCCLHVDVTLAITPDEWLDACERALPSLTSVPGLTWKLWLLDRERGRAGGLYLFRDSDAARAYVGGPILERLRRSPAVRALSTELLPVVDSLSRRTFGLPGSPADPAATAEEHATG